MDIEEEVKTHTQRVEAGERVRYGRACPDCGAAEEEFFRMHDCRRRKFRLLVERYIQVVVSWILRWRCLRCGKRFTDYPPFRLAAETVRPAAGAGEGWQVPGNGTVLS
jgi:transposase